MFKNNNIEPRPQVKNKNYKNYLIVTCILALVAIVGTGIAIGDTPWDKLETQKHSKSKYNVTNQAYFPVKRCINMAGGLEAPNEGDWGYVFKQDDFTIIRLAGFDTVRIPINWANHTSAQSPYTIDPAFIKRVDQIVAWALENKLSIVLTLHNFKDLYNDPTRNTDKLISIWSQLSQHYKNLPPEVFFEIINEPQDTFVGDISNKAQARALQEIRKYNPKRTVIMGGDDWSSIHTLEGLEVPSDPYVIVTVHYYEPFEFTHQGAKWMPNAPPKGRKWPEKNDRENLYDTVDDAVKWRDKNKIPLFLGEFGTETNIPNHLRALWAGDVYTTFTNAKIPTCYFNYEYGFEIHSEESGWNLGILRAIGG